MLRKKTEQQIEEVYQIMKPYLNKKGRCNELHFMCKNCEKFCGIKEQDYSECRDLQCFKNWLGLAYLNLANGH